jgi:hypothetical protein
MYGASFCTDQVKQFWEWKSIHIKIKPGEPAYHDIRIQIDKARQNILPMKPKQEAK